MFFPDHHAAQRTESSVGQQEWMYWQMSEAAQSTRRGGIDFPDASWTPPWEYVTDPNPSQDNPNMYGYVPAFSVIRHTIRQLQSALQHHRGTSYCNLTPMLR
eukprot:5801904-Pyramimonas_sp.AAC.1